MKRFIYWASIAAGVAAAYLMYRRGEPVGAIARKTLTNPVGSLVNEVQQAV